MTDLQRPTGPAEEDPTAGDEPQEAGGSMGRFFGDLSSDLGELIRREVELALTEMKDELMQAAKAGSMLGAGALTGYFALLFSSFALAWILDKRLPRWLAFGVVAGIHGTVAATLVARGREEMLQVDPVPRQTVETLKENVDTIRGLGS